MINTTKVTKRVMFETIKSMAENGDIPSEVIVQVGDNEVSISANSVIEFCEKEIAALDRKAAKAKETAAAKKSASDELTEAIYGVLTNELTSIADIATMIEGEEVTPAKCQYRLNKLVEAGRAVKDELVLETEGGKKRKVVGFALAPIEE